MMGEETRSGGGSSRFAEATPRPREESSRAERAYLEHLLSVSEGSSASFESFCEGRRDLGEALRDVALEWAELFDSEPPANVSREFAVRLLDRYGEGLSSGEAVESGSKERIVPLRPVDPRYQLGEEIGRGGMGAVFEAEDLNLRRRVAMKVILGRAGGADGASPVTVSPVRLRRFLEEARVTGGLDHPSIVPVHELGLDDSEVLFFTMRLVQGRELGRIFELARQGEDDWTTRRALEVLLKVCDVVALAHSRRITHRDLKPSNVLVGDFGEVYCLDWGLARREEGGETSRRQAEPGSEDVHTDSAARTLDGTVIGTPSYMSPEQALGRPEATGPHTDVYGLGAMLYHLLTGHPPFVEKGSATPPREVLDAVLFGELEPIDVRHPDTPPELVAICEKAMARDPRQRYAGARELAGELRAFLDGRVVRALESGPWAELRKWIGRHRGLAATILVGFLLAFSCLGLVAILNERSTRDLTLLLDGEIHDHLVRSESRLWPAHPVRRPGIEQWLSVATELVGRLDEHRARLASWNRELSDEERETVDWIVGKRESLALALTPQRSGGANVWRYLTQRDLVGDLERLSERGGLLPSVQADLRNIERMEREREPSAEWTEAAEAIRSSSWYEGLELGRQLGLVPLGPDPVTGLWEFGHWPSGDIPVRDEHGRLEIRAESSLVFVLIPGGVFEQGALPSSDAWARKEEAPVEGVALGALFLSKYELTRGQLRRLLGERDGMPLDTDLLPAVPGNFDAARGVVRHHFLGLPTEAQWEYAARAGTTTPWYVGDCLEEVSSFANLGGAGACDPFEDELAPIGSFPPNPFGLHDVLGNLSEWCQEVRGSYVVPPEGGDGFRRMVGGSRVVRGGNYQLGPEDARAARRMEYREARNRVGVRPARAIDPEQWVPEPQY